MGNKYSGDGEVVETIYGRRSVFEVVKNKGFISTDFTVFKDGKRWKGAYKDLSKAVEVAKNEG